MPNERSPAKPLPPSYVPPNGTAYTVKDGDDWYSVARDHQRDVYALIYFNFQTLMPEEVNWYLKRNVGCNVTKDGQNWAFSSRLKPGKIYIPPTSYTFDPTVITAKPPLRIDWTSALNYPHGGVHKTQFVLEVVDAVIIGLEIAEVAGVLAIAAPFVGAAVVVLIIGNAHADAIAKLKKDQMMDGYSLGIVLGVNGAQPVYVKNNFFKHFPVHNAVYPEQGKSLQNAYNQAMVAGYATGRKLNNVQIVNLLGDLHARMGGDDVVIQKYGKGVSDAKKWSEGAKQRYYRDAASAFKIAHLR